MKLLIPVAGTLAVVACAAWAYLSHTSRKKVVLYKAPCSGSNAEIT